MRRLRAIFLALCLALAAPPAAAICNARFLNPITEVCWDCIFPISIGGFSFSIGGSRYDPPNPSFPICFCPGLPPRIGLAIGLWEPARLIDVANEAGCFVNMGFELDFGLFSVGRSTPTSLYGTDTGSKWQAHYYLYPLISWLGVIVDGLCLQNTQFDIAYISEIDPLWQNAELTNLINPEAILFANPIAQAACAAECASTSAGGATIPGLFWCNGCQGGLYPISGDVNSHIGGIQASQTVSAKMLARMHRLLLARQTQNESSALCENDLEPILRKQQYRLQVTRPVPSTAGRYACSTLGASTQFVDFRREFPRAGESFGWLIWRKRNCCAL
jgi:conjugal transfer pilus assembly protein TraU